MFSCWSTFGMITFAPQCFYSHLSSLKLKFSNMISCKTDTFDLHSYFLNSSIFWGKFLLCFFALLWCLHSFYSPSQPSPLDSGGSIHWQKTWSRRWRQDEKSAQHCSASMQVLPVLSSSNVLFSVMFLQSMDCDFVKSTIALSFGIFQIWIKLKRPSSSCALCLVSLVERFLPWTGLWNSRQAHACPCF